MSDELRAKLKTIVMRFGWITEDDDWERAIDDIAHAFTESGYALFGDAAHDETITFPDGTRFVRENPRVKACLVPRLAVDVGSEIVTIPYSDKNERWYICSDGHRTYATLVPKGDPVVGKVYVPAHATMVSNANIDSV